MKKYAWLVGTVVCLLCLFALNSGISLAGIDGSKHDLSSDPGGSGFEYETTEKCAFCHTPHRANSNFKSRTIYNSTGSGSYETTNGSPLMLWNRALPTNSVSSWFQLYTSDTMTLFDGQRGPKVVGVYSLMCLSCHDGVGSMRTLTTPPADGQLVGGDLIDTGHGMSSFSDNPCTAGQPCPNIGERDGGNAVIRLQNDHPVTIDYSAARAADSGLKLKTDAETVGMRFWPDPSAPQDPARRNFVECSTCHNPHEYGDIVAGTTPFLVVSKNQSALCLACHIK